MHVRPLPPKLQKKAETELNEDPARTQEDLNQIREWLEKQPHLNARTGDQWLISFLRGCKFSLQRTKEKLEYFYSLRTLIPDYFANRDPFLPEIQEILNAGVVIPLPKTNGVLGPRVVLFYYRNLNSDTMTLRNIIKVYLMISDILMLEDDDCVVSGISLWPDLYHTPVSFLMQFTPPFLKQIFMCMQKAYPLRIKGIYSTSVPSIFEATINFAKTFMSQKVQERTAMFSEKNFSNICDFVPRDVHPNDIGGNGGYVKDIAAAWKKKVESYKEWFLEDEKYRSGVTKRLAATRDDLFGMEGSFRGLNID